MIEIESPQLQLRRLLIFLQKDLPQRSSPKGYLLVATIDIGTTSSCYAFSFTSDKENILMNKNWGSPLGFQALKTETSVLLSPKKEFMAFGFEASERYAILEVEESDAKKHYYFPRFKMNLHTEKTLSEDTTIEDVNGKQLPALDIFAHAIRYMTDHMLDAISRTVSAETMVNINDICLVLTVPAIWGDSAKQFMRQAAYKAGIASQPRKGQLLIALEPEAVGVFCINSLTNQQRVDVKPGDRCMIVDCLGGTAVITVHEISENGVNAVTTASGEDWGGTKVDEAFLKLLDNIFGADMMAQYKAEHPTEYLDLLNQFEIKKQSIGFLDSGKVMMLLGYNMFRFYPKHKQGCTVQQAIKLYDSKEVEFYNGMIRISHALMKSFFAPAIDSILNHHSLQLTPEEIAPLKYMFILGSIAQYPILQHTIKEKFQGLCTVLVPDESELSIVKGAVMFGHITSSVAARRCKNRSGVHVPYEPEHHPDRSRVQFSPYPQLCVLEKDNQHDLPHLTQV